MNKVFLEKEAVIKAISAGSKKEACKILGISGPTLRRILKEYGIDAKEDPYSFLTKEWFQSEWQNTTKSLNDLSKEFGIPLSLLESRSSRLGVKKWLKYSINLNKFFDLNDPHTWYLAGLVATDGYLGHSKSSISVGLVGESERHLLEDILSYYESNSSVRCYGHSVRVEITAVGVREFYETNFGIPYKFKTSNITTPKEFPNESCAKAYIRGCLDGDGWIKSGGKRFSLCTDSDRFVRGVCDVIQTYTGISINFGYEKRRNRAYPVLRKSGQSARAVLDWVYSLENCFKLERKYICYCKVDDIV